MQSGPEDRVALIRRYHQPMRTTTALPSKSSFTRTSPSPVQTTTDRPGHVLPTVLGA